MATTDAATDHLLLEAFGSRNGSAMPTISPSAAVIGRVHTWVIVGVTVVVAIVFIAVYLQLSAVLYYGYKLISYQTIFLFNILLWASFRLTFNSFYFYYCCELIAKISPTSKWFLISFPEVLLFLSLALLVHYFLEHLNKVIKRRHEVSYLNPSYKKLCFYRYTGSVLWALCLFVYIVVNVTLGYLIFLHKVHRTWQIVRVVVLESLILIMGIVLGVCMLVIYATRAGKDIMDAKRVSKWQAVTISTLLILLFASRAVYNMIAVNLQSPEKSSTLFLKFATDLADFHTSEEGDINFFCVLLIWEIVPICLIVVFFRIRTSIRISMKRSASPFSSETSRHFFHGGTLSGRRSVPDSSVNSTFHKSSHVSIPSLPGQTGLPFSTAGYGSTNRTHYSVPNNAGYNPPSFMPGTTPPQLFTGSPSVFSDSHVNNNNNNNNFGLNIND